MLNFLISGFIFLIYVFLKFKTTKILYPSVIFSAMWGFACMMMFFILDGNIENLFLADYYTFKYIDKYIVPFTFVSIAAFIVAHKIFPGKKINVTFNESYLSNILKRYHWIMWLNFFGGIMRIILMVNLVGFESVMDYRLAANAFMMHSSGGVIGITFKITAYIQMLANFYIAVYGFKAGLTSFSLKSIIGLFILYSTNQMATGGRLFVLYFLLFYFGSFLLGRGYIHRFDKREFLQTKEIKILGIALFGILSIVPLIALSRHNDDNMPKESAMAKFTYITEGILLTEHYMRFHTPEKMTPYYGEHLFSGLSPTYLKFRGYLNKNTRMSSVVKCIITPLYEQFGYYGSIIVWGIIALIMESLFIVLLKRMTIIRFLIVCTILKIMYESIIAPPIMANIPTYELIILFALFKKMIFGGDAGVRNSSLKLN